MRLKRLCLVGFKSFADRTNLELDWPLTGLVGPNGCGKSNIVDAIRWVLGEQSARQLRGREMADVIFGGTDRRKPTGYAEVTLTLTNEERALPVDYDEVVIARRLYRSGESEYLLNKQHCRLRDIRQLLLGTGLGMNAYSIIEQGRVDQLLTASAKERRAVFEEAAGIRRFKLQRRECELKLDRTEQNLLRVSDIIEEVEKQLRSVKYQAAKARRYKEHAVRLKELRARLSLGDYGHLVDAQADLTRRIADLTGAVERSEAHLRALRDGAARTEAELAQLDERVNAAERLSVELAGRLTNAQAAAEHHRESAQRLEAQARRHDQQVADAAEKLAAAQRRREALEAGLAELSAMVHRRETELADGRRRLDEADAALDEKTRRLEDQKTAAIDLLRRTSKIQNELGAVTGLQRTLSAQRDRQGAQRDELKARADAARADARRLEARGRDLTHEKGEAERRLAELDARRRQGMEQLDAAQRELAAARQRLSALASRRDVLVDMEARLEGVGEAVKALLATAEGTTGVYGLVADLVRVPRDYVPAIEAALDEAADYLVVDSSRRAMVLLESAEAMSREAALPFDRVGFICCDGARARARSAAETVSAAVRSLPGYVGGAYDLVKPAPVARTALAALLGGTVVVRDLATAVALVSRDGAAVGRGRPSRPMPDIFAASVTHEALATLFNDSLVRGDFGLASVPTNTRQPAGRALPLCDRAVTLAGDVVTGEGRLLARVRPRMARAAEAPGTNDSPALSHPSGGRIWRRSELEHLTERITDLEMDIARREADCADTGERLQALQADHTERAAECDRYAVELVRLNGDLDRAGKQAASLDDEVALLTSELKAIGEDVAEAKASEADLARRRAQLEDEHQGLRARIAEAGTDLEARRHEVAEQREALTQVKVALAEAGARRTDTEANLAGVEQDVTAWQRSRDSGAQAAQQARDEAERAREQAREADRRIEALGHEQEQVTERRAALAEQRRELADRRERAVAERDQVATQREQLNQQRQALEVQAGEVRVKREDLVQRTREDLDMDLAALYEQTRSKPDPLGAGAQSTAADTSPSPQPSPRQGEGDGQTAAGSEAPEDLEALRTEIADVRGKIERLGGVNMDALDELDDLEIRATFLNKQRDDLTKATADLQQVIRKINRQCREMFTATFEQVREHFQELFRKLFGGGKADMFLDAEEGEEPDVLESGIEIIARPPGKEPRVLSLLSGGEKVMTAVALLLAIFRSNPSPFCLLDEVDAALDESAIGRFVEVLKGFVDRSQFIIVTHSKRTMAAADALYGVTMPEPGVSRIMTVQLKEVEQRIATPRVA